HDFKAVWSRPLLGIRGLGISTVQALGCSGDGTVVLCADAFRTFRLDADTGAVVSSWHNPLTASVTEIAVSPSGHAAAFCAASTLYYQRFAPDEAEAIHRLGKTHFMA